MNKGDMVDRIATDAGITKQQAQDALDSVIQTTSAELKNGNKVTLVGFGTFSVSKRSARKGRNPQSGAEINIPEKTVVKFKPGKDLSDYVK
jgi:DNA-binding protein HU-beta